MHVVVIKYMQVFCITVFFTNNVNCDQLLLQNEHEDQRMYGVTSCVAQCLHNEINVTVESCYKTCNEEHHNFDRLNNITSNLYVKLICRNDTSLVIEILRNPELIQHKMMIDGRHVKSDLDNNQTSIKGDGGVEKNDRSQKLNMLRKRKKKRSTTSGHNILPSSELLSSTSNKNPTHIMEKLQTVVYLIKVQESGDPFAERWIYMSNSSMVKIENLHPNRLYNISVSTINSDLQFSYVNGITEFSTLETKYHPAEIKNILKDPIFINRDDSNHLDAVIMWEPEKDMVCHYEIVCFSSDDSMFDVLPAEIHVPEVLYNYTIRNLNYNREYLYAIRGKNKNFKENETVFTWNTINTPTCLEWNNNDLDMCPPPQPFNLQSSLTYITDNHYDINVSWDKPQLTPSYYVVRILDLNPDGNFSNPNTASFNISGNSTEIIFRNMEIIGVRYMTYVTAFSNGGNSSNTIEKQIDIKVLLANKWRILKIVLAVIAPIFVLIIIFLLIILICHRRAKLKRYEERCRYFEALEEKAPIDPNSNFDLKSKNIIIDLDQQTILDGTLECMMFACDDEMEIPRCNIKILQLLGEGAFGLVKKGILLHNDKPEREIAVKMLKDKPTFDDFKEFKHEIEVMKSVGRHPNIVSIIGHCTKNVNELMLITEYCAEGNLLNYLRTRWARFERIMQSNINSDCHTPSLLSQKTPENVFNFDTSFVDKAFKYKNFDENTMNDNNDDKPNYISPSSDHIKQHMDSTCDHNNELVFNTANLIINKLYDEYNTSKTSMKFIDEHSNSNSHKCSKESSKDLDDVEMMKQNLEKIVMDSDKCLADDNDRYAALSETIHNQTELKTNNDNRNNEEHHKLNADADDDDPDDDELYDRKLNKKNLCDCISRGCGGSGGGIDGNGGRPNKIQGIALDFKVAADDGDVKNCDRNSINLINNIANNSSYQPINNLDSKNNSRQNNLDKMSIRSRSINDIEGRTVKRHIEDEYLTSTDLLSFAKQIAKGMEFLSKNKVVHRDLAARNVLVSADKTVKIADFGLSRDIYQENIYKKTGNGKLPIKWLALESMTHQIYTSQSDVWSFGILMYEIVTLGGTPYPSIPTNRLLNLLKAGYRMEKPNKCSQEVYDLMHSCWNSNPQARPTFVEISEKLNNQCWEFDLTSNNRRIKASRSNTDESYLKPI